MDNKKKAEILSTITKEQWEAIASLTQEQWEEVLNRSEVRRVKSQNFEDDKELKIKLSYIMRELGITANLIGYNYLMEAVICVYKDSSYMKVTKKLYPHIAKKFNTTVSRVERAIRHAIMKSFDNCDVDVINEYYTYSPNKGCATNSEAIASLADYIKLYE